MAVSVPRSSSKCCRRPVDQGHRNDGHHVESLDRLDAPVARFSDYWGAARRHDLVVQLPVRASLHRKCGPKRGTFFRSVFRPGHALVSRPISVAPPAPARRPTPRGHGATITAGVVIADLIVVGLALLVTHRTLEVHHAGARTSAQNLSRLLEAEVASSFERIDQALQSVADQHRLLAAGAPEPARDAAVREMLGR